MGSVVCADEPTHTVLQLCSACTLVDFVSTPSNAMRHNTQVGNSKKAALQGMSLAESTVDSLRLLTQVH